MSLPAVGVVDLPNIENSKFRNPRFGAPSLENSRLDLPNIENLNMGFAQCFSLGSL